MSPLLHLPVGILLALAASTALAVAVDFEIDMRSEIAAGRFDPNGDQVGVRGSAAPLSWQHTILAAPKGDGRFAVRVEFARVPFGGQPVQYKFRIERPGLGSDEGWEKGRNHPLVLSHAAQSVARAFDAEPAEVPLERTGTIERLALPASRHVSPREVQVWLPPGYASQRTRRYPVLYLHDGQNVFDARAAGAEWQVDETAQRLVEAGAIEPPIIVAVASGPDRFADYTPSSALLPASRTGLAMEKRLGGGAPRYARYLVEELKPAIDRRYRTRPEPASTTVGGSSLGGLVSMWLLLHEGSTFGAGLVVSPSVWWDDLFIVRDVAAATLPAAARPRLWLDMGLQEGGPEAIAAARRLRDALVARGWSGAALSYLEDPDGGHDEASWAARVEGMLRFLYGGKV